MNITDRYGNTLSTTNRAAVDRLDQGMEAILGFRADPLAEADAAIAAQPDFAMAHAFRANLMVMSGEAAAAAEGLRSVAAGEALRHANAREQAHLAAARAWCEGDLALAQARYGALSAAHPRDLCALQLAHTLDFFLGNAAGLRDRPTQALRDWREGEDGFSWLLGMQAFGLEECGAYAAAERAGRMALALNPRDAWATHAVAHVMEMQGRDEEGTAFLAAGEAEWSAAGLLAVHNWWHLALYHLERGAQAEVLAIYDRAIAPHAGSVTLELVDASAMLWRLMLRGIDTGTRFEAVSAAWERTGGAGFYAFNDLHAVMAHLGAGRAALADQVLAEMRQAATGQGTNARITRSIGLPLAEGFADFHRGAHAAAVARLAPVAGLAIGFGGSNAQRDVIWLTLLEASLRAGERGTARDLAARRLAAKPESPFARAQMARVQARAA
ncbi:tetratricopeptide repeat protein [Falsiroseomonas tokyonensis]|uniref:Tetratricopeptide repeat protein n=1 Tax=Falsiroseomonas tokyonensis TaxID=430521 RepID=A0ABV7BU07_9PROT|nr:tetratricopeptide repeat protein [Falsiroseomonas tokyonensis]MBU8537473.1 tetratricopeptide repeat protein [Falsiroseomonas tokyonensis]